MYTKDDLTIRVFLDSSVSAAGGFLVYWALLFGPYVARSVIQGFNPGDAIIMLLGMMLASILVSFIFVMPADYFLHKYGLYRKRTVYLLSLIFAIPVANLAQPNWSALMEGYLFPAIAGLVIARIHLKLSENRQ
jgi:hypothetical protein